MHSYVQSFTQCIGAQYVFQILDTYHFQLPLGFEVEDSVYQARDMALASRSESDYATPDADVLPCIFFIQFC